MGRRSRSVPAVVERRAGAARAGVSDEVVDRVYAELRKLQREATVDLAIRMGELVVKRFYEGNATRGGVVRAHRRWVVRRHVRFLSLGEPKEWQRFVIRVAAPGGSARDGGDDSNS
jgi:hypothetical protein